MQSQEPKARSAGALTHPAAAEWMAYLYDETAPERRRELKAHLAQCADCGERLNQWRAGALALDDWKLPVRPRKSFVGAPALMFKWAAAVAIVLALGFVTGRVSSSHARDVAELKIAMAQLMEKADLTQSQAGAKPTREELLQLLADYSKLNEERRTEDRRVVGLALREMDLRLGKLRAELETVALNTASGFQQTEAGLTTLASYTAAERGGGSELKSPETKN